MNRINNLIVFISFLLISACSTTSTNVQNQFDNIYSFNWTLVGKNKQFISINEVVDKLAGYDVVVFGEAHGHPAVHLAQMQLFELLNKQSQQEYALSLEQFERDTQSDLNDYLSGEIGEDQLIKVARAWDNYKYSYRPLVEYAKLKKLPVIAANAPKHTVLCVGRKGVGYLDTLDSDQRDFVAQQINTGDSAYKQRYFAFLSNSSSHGHSADSSEMMKKMTERSYSAQVIRDETMAESIAKHRRDNPKQRVLHLTGSYHADYFQGTVERLQQRMPDLKIAVIHPDDKTHAQQEKQAINDADIATINLIVKSLPERFIQDDNRLEWSKKILKKRLDFKCQ
ncbi:MAG: ChaN family lipoprotein [Gammaproteobacteria bacterium]|nr:ChaN family lipoprotein [Candidatus Brocadiales bacterium]MBL7002749.1 ChaN family lipoprotein [Gammaproteobacteria bacterium]